MVCSLSACAVCATNRKATATTYASIVAAAGLARSMRNLRRPSAHEFIGEQSVIGFELIGLGHEAGLDVEALGIAEHRFDHDRRHRRAELHDLEGLLDYRRIDF